MTRKPCLHCQTERGTIAAYGICYACYRDPNVRRKYYALVMAKRKFRKPMEATHAKLR